MHRNREWLPGPEAGGSRVERFCLIGLELHFCKIKTVWGWLQNTVNIADTYDKKMVKMGNVFLHPVSPAQPFYKSDLIRKYGLWSSANNAEMSLCGMRDEWSSPWFWTGCVPTYPVLATPLILQTWSTLLPSCRVGDCAHSEFAQQLCLECNWVARGLHFVYMSVSICLSPGPALSLIPFCWLDFVLHEAEVGPQGLIVHSNYQFCHRSLPVVIAYST